MRCVSSAEGCGHAAQALQKSCTVVLGCANHSQCFPTEEQAAAEGDYERFLGPVVTVY